MTLRISLSPKTFLLITKLKNKDSVKRPILEFFQFQRSQTFTLAKLNSWLAREKFIGEDELKDDVQILLASLDASLLKDLANALPNYKKKPKLKEKTSQSSKAKYLSLGLFVLAGAIVFGCEGFDGIAAIVSVLPVTMPVLLVIGIFCACISIASFCAFYLSDVENDLELNKKKNRQLVDNYISEIQQINSIRKHLRNQLIRKKSKADFEIDLLILEMLAARYKVLEERREALEKKIDNKKIIITKYLVAGVISILYFSGGFFAGQAVAMSLVGFFVTSTTPVFWPVLLISFIVGLAAFSIYWLVERPNIDKKISLWFGIDEDKIERIGEAETIERHKSKLADLKSLSLNKLAMTPETKANYASRLEAANKKIRKLRQLLAQPGKPQPQEFPGEDAAVKASTHQFFSLRSKSQILIEKLRGMGSQTTKIATVFKTDLSDRIKLSTLIKWFNPKHEAQTEDGKLDEATKLELDALNSSLLKDFAVSLPNSASRKKPKNPATKNKELIYILLTITGSVYSGCQGFDGIASIIGLFSLPNAIVFACGVVFAFISMLVFYAVDLAGISSELGIKNKKTSHLADVYLQEVAAIKIIRKCLDERYANHQTLAELKEDLQITQLLIIRYKKLDEGRKALKESLKSPKLTALKYAVSAFIGFVCFCSGFFTGQMIAMTIAGFFVTTVAPLAWPVVLASMVVGVAALAVYWYKEHVNIEKLVTRLCGIDQDKIEELTNPEKVREQKAKLATLKTNLKICKNNFLSENSENLQQEREFQKASKEINRLTEKLRQKSEDSPVFRRGSVADKPDSFFSARRLISNPINELNSVHSL